LADVSFRRKRDERWHYESSKRNMNHPSHGVHDFSAQRRPARPRGALPLIARPQAVRPQGGRARRGVSRVPYGQGPNASGFGSPSLAEHYLLLVVIAIPPWDQGCLVFSLTLFRDKCCSTSILHSLLTPVLCHLLTSCLIIEVEQRPGEHVAHGFWLFVPHD
jgi:hypothetical protein